MSPEDQAEASTTTPLSDEKAEAWGNVVSLADVSVSGSWGEACSALTGALGD